MHDINIFSICGSISSGKTTLAKLIGNFGFLPVLEDFSGNPFLNIFYADPSSYAFETEITFLLQHYHQIKTALQSSNDIICDFSLIQDLAYARVTLDNNEQKAFLAVYNEVIRKLHFASKLIYISCSPEILIHRIHNRGRPIEQTVTLDYINKIDDALKEEINKKRDLLNVIHIDSEKYNFAENEKDIQIIKRIILKE